MRPGAARLPDALKFTVDPGTGSVGENVNVADGSTPAPARAAGYAVLPAPSLGDVFFDLEGDPYVGDTGIEYLWGWWTAEAGYEWVWAHDHDAEKAAFEQFVDRVVELRGRRAGHARVRDHDVAVLAPHGQRRMRYVPGAGEPGERWWRDWW